MPASLYDYPRYYDLVFGSDWKAEFDFLRRAFDKFAAGRVRSVFEPACGTGRLLFRLALAGYDVSGLDLNPRAVDYCKKRLAKVGRSGPERPAPQARSPLRDRQKAKPAVFVGDMAHFALPRPVDAAFNMINSFRHLLTEEQALAHLRCIAAALRPGGIYVLGLHLAPTEGTPLEQESWSARRGHLGIVTHLRTFDLNLRGRTERCTMTMDVYTPTRHFQITDELTFRTYTHQQFYDLLAAVPELEPSAVFDFSYRLTDPIEIGADTQDVVLILRRVGRRGPSATSAAS